MTDNNAAATSFETLVLYPANRAELRLVDAYAGNSLDWFQHAAINAAAASRGKDYATRFRNAVTIARRMPELLTVAIADGRITLDHIDAVWRKLDRNGGVRTMMEAARLAVIDRGGNAVTDNAAIGQDARVDQAVSDAITEWLTDNPADATAPTVPVRRMQDLTGHAADRAYTMLHQQRRTTAPATHPGNGTAHRTAW